VVLLVNPFAPLSAGFVLSFAAVFILGYCFSGRVNNWPSKRREKRVGEGARFYIWQLCRTQWVMTLGMPGFLLASVSQLSLVSMAANLLALPVIGLLVVPSALMACLLIPVWEASGKAFAWLAYYLIEGLWYWLSMIGELNQVIPARGSSFLAVVLCVIAGMVCLLPVAFRARWLGLTLVLPILFLPLQRLNTGIARITVLDVGQGLAVLIETRQHRVLYDTGPRFSDKFDAGDQIVVPAIHLRGHGEIDELIVSHGDMDHAGGYDAVVRRLQVGRIHKGSEMDCQPHRKWEYDQIVFELTGLEDGQNSNNNSCILRLSASHHSMLIPGDIEAPGESSLVRRYRLGGFNLAADLLISPHHGSQTSSTPGFLNAVSPSAVIVSAGFQNRFGHPHQRVMYRYENRGIRILETARSGAITIELSTTGISVSEARKDHPRLWHNH
ncbi:MAG: DNA internalization-related competence protein ComEC/Rec2, partial [Gammaproteobacteria bacterium]|nr:DNA internalization-related competence protein ComEC/Rec2 [Gammaproteobacteria bacterium]